MARESKRLEMRVSREGGETAQASQVERALEALDPTAKVRIDPATGIAHVASVCDTMEVEEALTRAGFEVTAATG